MASRERKRTRRAPAKAQRAKPRDDRLDQVGRRPSPPALLFAIAAAWIAAGVIAIVTLSASWRFVPGIVFTGFGLLYLRAALTTVARRGER